MYLLVLPAIGGIGVLVRANGSNSPLLHYPSPGLLGIENLGDLPVEDEGLHQLLVACMHSCHCTVRPRKLKANESVKINIHFVK